MFSNNWISKDDEIDKNNITARGGRVFPDDPAFLARDNVDLF